MPAFQGIEEISGDQSRSRLAGPIVGEEGTADIEALRGRGAPEGGRPLKFASAVSTNLRTSGTGQPCGFCIASKSSDVASLLLAVMTKSIARRPLKIPRFTDKKGLAP